MSEAIAEFARRAGALNVDRSGGSRMPHKPLLLLHALARLFQNGEHALHFLRIAVFIDVGAGNGHAGDRPRRRGRRRPSA